MISRLPLRVAVAVGALAILAGCNLPPPASDPEARAEYFETNDPLEPVNRVTHTFNQAVDTMLLRPAAEAYRIFIPQPIRTGLGNFLDNLLLPRTTVYNALQGNPDRAADSFSRFAINTTLGVFGIFDFASDMGFPPQFEDMGQNLAVWGGTLDGGPYIVLPILGPSNVRDTTGRIIDFFTDPWQWLGQGDTVEALRAARIVAQAIDTREGLIEPLDALKAQSLDYYAAIRSLYRQQRDRDILNQSVGQRRYFDWTGERQGLPQ